MSNSSNETNLNKQKLQQVIALLKFIQTLDDEEIIKSTIESVTEILEEIIK